MPKMKNTFSAFSMKAFERWKIWKERKEGRQRRTQGWGEVMEWGERERERGKQGQGGRGDREREAGREGSREGREREKDWMVNQLCLSWQTHAQTKWWCGVPPGSLQGSEHTHLEGKPVASTTVNKVGDSGDLLEVIRISEGPMQRFLSEQGELLPQETDPLWMTEEMCCSKHSLSPLYTYPKRASRDQYELV